MHRRAKEKGNFRANLGNKSSRNSVEKIKIIRRTVSSFVIRNVSCRVFVNEVTTIVMRTVMATTATAAMTTMTKKNESFL